MTHVAPSVATQEQYPWKTTLRTIVQVGLPTVLTLLVVAPIIIQIVVEELGSTFPEGVNAWLAGASALIISISAAITRIMAIPAVNHWLSHIGLAPTPTVPHAEARHAAE